jgi:AbiJ N-terminal domain 4
VSFSERYGYSLVRQALQREEMDTDLRTALWNVLEICFWQHRRGYLRDEPRTQPDFAPELWASHLRFALDHLPSDWGGVLRIVRPLYFSYPWNKVYDFLEFMAAVDENMSETFQDACNAVLEREMSAYRIVAGHVTEITAGAEIEAIEEAIAASGPLTGVRAHLTMALDHLSDRVSPDYRNSIKESISAVEALANVVGGARGETLGVLLRRLEPTLELHPALDAAFSKLYGYTSDAEGIRHALMDEPNLSFEDAKLMLVACSAFVNYLAAKAGKAGIAL